MPKQSTIAFHNGSNYDYHFIIKELAEEFEKQFIYLGENTEKYVSFSVPVEKEVTKVDTRKIELLEKPYPTDYHLLIA